MSEGRTKMKQKQGFFLKQIEQMNRGAMVSGVGFLLYLGASALAWDYVALGIAIIFGFIALYTFLSTLTARSKDREAVSYSLMWGTGALTFMLLGCAALTIKMYLGM